MTVAKSIKKKEHLSLVSQELTEEITEVDERNFWEVVATDLTEKQIQQILNPIPVHAETLVGTVVSALVAPLTVLSPRSSRIQIQVQQGAPV